MMQVLQQAGIPLLCDEQRPADADNPRGYFEYEPVKRLATDNSWLPAGRGKALKVVSPLLKHLPVNEHYRLILMRRDVGEVLASQRAMMQRRDQDDAMTDRELRAIYEGHLFEVKTWLRRNAAFDVHEVLFGPLVRYGAGLDELAAWLPGEIDGAAMRHAVDPTLYRQRQAPACRSWTRSGRGC